MGNSLRWCLGCVLPCGALDLIRIVHLNGSIQAISGPVTASDVLSAHPHHVLTKPCSLRQGGIDEHEVHNHRRGILILSPDSELRRGGIYFLIPESTLPDMKKAVIRCNADTSSRDHLGGHKSSKAKKSRNFDAKKHAVIGWHDFRFDDARNKFKSSSRRDGKRGHVPVWIPHLQSISEDCCSS